jgi:putative acetyltransferase
LIYNIRLDDLGGPDVARLLREHLNDMLEHSPPGSVHALDLDALRAPEITFWSAWHDTTLVGCGALRELDDNHGEIKSMRTAQDFRGKGVASYVLEHLLAEGKSRGYTRISLETGTAAVFEPARTLYRKFGFTPCEPFGEYILSENNQFFTRLVQNHDEAGR